MKYIFFLSCFLLFLFCCNNSHSENVEEILKKAVLDGNTQLIIQNINTLKKKLSNNCEDKEIYTNLIILESSIGEYEECLEMIKQMEEKELIRDDIELLITAGILYEWFDDKDKAYIYYSDALANIENKSISNAELLLKKYFILLLLDDSNADSYFENSLSTISDKDTIDVLKQYMAINKEEFWKTGLIKYLKPIMVREDSKSTEEWWK